MMRNNQADRRSLLRQSIGAAATLLLGGCEPLSEKPWVLRTLGLAEEVSLKAHRLLIPRDRLAPEFPATEISAQFKVNGSYSPDDERYQELAQSNFADWRLMVDGLFANPAEFSLPQLSEMPARTQITRRGLELHRQVERRAARRRPRKDEAQARGKVHRVPLR